MADVERIQLIEEELRITRDRLEMIAKATADAAYDTDLLRGANWVNENYGAMFGEMPPDTVEEVMQHWIDRVHPDDRARASNSIERVFESSASHWDVEYRYRHKDGHYLFVSDRAHVVRDTNGVPERAFGVLRDITTWKTLEQKQRNIDAKKLESLGVLAGGIAHDFNNLLTGILANSELIQLELSADSPHVPYLEQIQATSLRAADLCNQMLAYSGRGKFVISVFSLNVLIEDALQLIEVSLSKGVILKLNLSVAAPVIEGDVTQIRQVVMNLITNASDAVADKGGNVTITTGVMEVDSKYLSEPLLHDNLTEGKYSYLEISDQGCGMDQKTIEKMFDPFFSTKLSGRGLGLAAVLGIVRGHQGDLKVQSQPGKGSTIRVMFPFSDQPSESLDSDQQSNVLQGSGTVLVVDDEETVRMVSKTILERSGFDVLLANDGREAIEVFRSHMDVIDAVLMDLTMPHMDGEESYKQIRQLKPDVKVVIMSGYYKQEVTGQFSDQGLAGFIQKPFGQKALTRKIHEVIGT